MSQEEWAAYIKQFAQESAFWIIDTWVKTWIKYGE